MIEQYKAASGEISAQTFVEFVNNPTPTAEDAVTISETTSTNSSATQVDKTRVFVAYQRGVNGYAHLFCSVCEISENGEINVGEEVELSSIDGSGYGLSTTLVDMDSVFVCYVNETGQRTLFGQICSLSGVSVVSGTATRIAVTETTLTSQYSSAVTLEPGKVFVAYRTTSNYYLYGLVCSISGTTISAGTATAIVAQQHAGTYIEATLLTSSKVFVKCNSSTTTTYYLGGVVCSVSGTTISAGSRLRLSSFSGSLQESSSAIMFDNGKIAIFFNRQKVFYATVFTVFGTTVTILNGYENLQILSLSSSDAYYGMQAILLKTGSFLLSYCHQSETNYSLAAFFCTIGPMGEVVTTTPVDLHSQPYFDHIYANSFVAGTAYFVCWRGTQPIMISMASDIFCLSPSVSTVDGLTIGSLTESIPGDVWVLNTSESE